MPQLTTNTRNSNTVRLWDIYKYSAYYQGRLWICISKVVYWDRNFWGEYKNITPFLSLKNTKFDFPLLLDSNIYSSFISPGGVPSFLQLKWVLNVPGKSLWWFSPSSQNGDLSWFASFNSLKIQVTLDFFKFPRLEEADTIVLAPPNALWRKCQLLGTKSSITSPAQVQSPRALQQYSTAWNTWISNPCKAAAGPGLLTLRGPGSHHSISSSGRHQSQWSKWGLPWWSTWQCGGHGFHPWPEKIPSVRATNPVLHNPRAQEPQLLSPHSRARAPQQEESLQWEARAPQQRVAPICHNQRKLAYIHEDPTQSKINT